MHNPRIEIDPEQLREMYRAYLDPYARADEVADDYGMSGSAMLRQFHAAGLPLKSAVRRSREFAAEVNAYYREHGIEEAMERYRVSHDGMYRLFIRYDLPTIRGVKHARRELREEST